MKDMMQFFDRIRDLISDQSGITCSVSHHFLKIRIHSYNTLPIEKLMV